MRQHSSNFSHSEIAAETLDKTWKKKKKKVTEKKRDKKDATPAISVNITYISSKKTCKKKDFSLIEYYNYH